MSVIEDLIRRITEKPGQTTTDLAAACSMPSAAVLGLLRHEPRVHLRGRKWYPTEAPAAPGEARVEHPATLKAARVVLAEVGGLLCGALAVPLPEHPPTLPEIEEMIRDLHQRSVRQLAHAMGEIADPVREGEMQRLLSRVKQMHGVLCRLRERLSGAIEAGREILDLLAEERAE